MCRQPSRLRQLHYRDAVGRALDDAQKLDRILGRHLADEEDIVIPALLQG